jgi:hypothetical protein
MLINGKSVDIAKLTPDALESMITNATQR